MLIDIHTHRTPDYDAVFRIYNRQANEFGLNIEHGLTSWGIHPWFADIESLPNEIILLEKALKAKNINVVGECGLDRLTSAPFNDQMEVFCSQLVLAEKYNCPVIVHCVRYYNELLQLRKTFHKTPWIIHGFTGSPETAIQLMDKNCFISLGKRLLKNDRKILKVLEIAYPNKLFFETDEWKGEIKSIYKIASDYLEIKMETLISAINCNFKNVFNNEYAGKLVRQNPNVDR